MKLFLAFKVEKQPTSIQLLVEDHIGLYKGNEIHGYVIESTYYIYTGVSSICL